MKEKFLLIIFVFTMVIFQMPFSQVVRATPVVPTDIGTRDSNDSDGGTSITIDKDAGTAEGDLMIASITWYSSAIGSATINSTPSGWTQVGSTLSQGIGFDVFRHAVFYKLATASEPADYTWGFNNSTDVTSISNTTYTNVDSANPVQASNSNSGDSDTISLASLSNNTAGSSHYVSQGWTGASSFNSSSYGFVNRNDGTFMTPPQTQYERDNRDLAVGSYAFSATLADTYPWHAIGIMINPNDVTINQSTHAWYANSNYNFNPVYDPSTTRFNDELLDITFDDVNNKLYTVSRKGDENIWIERRNLDGTLDTSFSSDGIIEETVTLNFSDSARGSLVVDTSTQDIYVYFGNIFEVIRKYDSTGSLDTSFGSSGEVTPSHLSDPDDERLIIDESASRFYLLATDYTTDGEWDIAQYDYNGSLDTGFGSSGVLTIEPGSDRENRLFDGVVSGGDLFLSGIDYSGDAFWYIRSVDKNTGSTNTTFGTSGNVTSDPSASDDMAFTIDSDGTNLYIGGSQAGSDGRIEKRLNSTGALVATFGSSGVNTYSNGEVEQVKYESGKLYAARRDFNAGYIERINSSNGSSEEEDSSYFYDGIFDINTTDNVIYINEPLGYGPFALSEPSDYHVIHARQQLSLGSSYNTFDGDGQLYINEFGEIDEMKSVAISSDGNYAYYAGHQTANGTSALHVQKRDLSDGNLVSGFGTSGILDEVPSDEDNVYIQTIALDDTNDTFFVGGSKTSYHRESKTYVQKRNSTTGNIETGFGTGGSVVEDNTTDINTNRTEYVSKIVVDASGLYLYVIKNINYDNNSLAYVEVDKRKTTDGSLCTAANCGTEFGTAGVLTMNADQYSIEDAYLDESGGQLILAGFNYVGAQVGYVRGVNVSDGTTSAFGEFTYNPDSGSDRYMAITEGPSGSVYLGGGRSINNGTDTNPTAFIEKRTLSNGSLDGTFGTSGRESYDPDFFFDEELVVDLAYSDEQQTLFTYLSAERFLHLQTVSEDSINVDIHMEARDASTGSLKSNYFNNLNGKELVDFSARSFGEIAVSDTQDVFLHAYSDEFFTIEMEVVHRNSFDGLINFTDSRLGADNQTTSTLGADVPFRLRLGTVANGTQNTLAPFEYKLQFASKSGTCDTGFSGETYQDLTTSSGMYYYDNSNRTNDYRLPTYLDNPAPNGSATVAQSYHESDSELIDIETNTAANQDALFDFSLSENTLSFDEGYCVRLVLSDGTELDSYITIPTVINCSNPPMERRLRGGKFFCSEELRPFIWNGFAAF